MGLPIQLLLNPAPESDHGPPKHSEYGTGPQQEPVADSWAYAIRQHGGNSPPVLRENCPLANGTAHDESSFTQHSPDSTTPPSDILLPPISWEDSSQPTGLVRTTRRANSRRGGNSHGTFSFAISQANAGPRRRGPLSAEQRKRTALIRKMGACWNCRRKKVSVSSPKSLSRPCEARPL